VPEDLRLRALPVCLPVDAVFSRAEEVIMMICTKGRIFNTSILQIRNGVSFETATISP
jgi:hypothetical protein